MAACPDALPPGEAPTPSPGAPTRAHFGRESARGKPAFGSGGASSRRAALWESSASCSLPVVGGDLRGLASRRLWPTRKRILRAKTCSRQPRHIQALLGWGFVIPSPAPPLTHPHTALLFLLCGFQRALPKLRLPRPLPAGMEAAKEPEPLHVSCAQGVSSENVYDYFKGREPTLYGRNNRFEGMSTTADTYRQWEMPPPPAPRAHPPPAASAPFDGTTSYKKDYPAHPLEPHAVMPQQVRHDLCPAKTTGSPPSRSLVTSTVLLPISHKPSPELSQRYLGTQRPVTNTPCAPTCLLVTDSQWKCCSFATANHTTRPQTLQVRAVKQMPFEGSTTYADVFKAYEIEPRSHPAAAPPPVQSVPFDGCSQYKVGGLPHAHLLAGASSSGA